MMERAYELARCRADDAMAAAVQLCSERHFLDRLDGLCRPAPSQKLQRFRFERVRRFKNFSNSFVARDGSRRMSCRSPSKGERSGTTNTRSFRSFLPFDDCRTSSTPSEFHAMPSSTGVIDVWPRSLASGLSRVCGQPVRESAPTADTTLVRVVLARAVGYPANRGMARRHRQKGRGIESQLGNAVRAPLRRKRSANDDRLGDARPGREALSDDHALDDLPGHHAGAGDGCGDRVRPITVRRPAPPSRPCREITVTRARRRIRAPPGREGLEPSRPRRKGRCLAQLRLTRWRTASSIRPPMPESNDDSGIM